MSPRGGGADHNYSSQANGGGGGSEIVLFGVRVKVDPMRKCVSLNDLSQYAHPQAQDVPDHPNADTLVSAAGYASADDANQHRALGGNRERKRGIPWTEEEHKLFLLGLQNVGKGDWKGISRNFVKTRTPTQVASHAQKHFLRRTNLNKRRRRSSLFDITSESVAAISMEEENLGDNTNHSIHPPKELIENDHVQPIPFLETPNNPIISLDLSLSSGQNHLARYSSCLNNGERIISVA